MVIRCKAERKRGETCCYRNKPELELSNQGDLPQHIETSSTTTLWLNNHRISLAYVPHLEKVYSHLRQKLGRKSGDDMNDLDTNLLIWGMFMSAALDAAVHLGKDYLENYIPPQTRHNERKGNCSMCHRRCSKIKQRIWRAKPINTSQQTSTAKERINRSQDPVTEPNELTRKHGWKWYPLTTSSSSSSSWWQSTDQWWEASSCDGR